jgi:hypothetical protein
MMLAGRAQKAFLGRPTHLSKEPPAVGDCGSLHIECEERNTLILMKSETVVSYDEICAQSIANPEELWGEAAKGVQWYKPFEKVFDDSKPPLFR